MPRQTERFKISSIRRGWLRVQIDLPCRGQQSEFEFEGEPALEAAAKFGALVLSDYARKCGAPGLSKHIAKFIASLSSAGETLN